MPRAAVFRAVGLQKGSQKLGGYAQSGRIIVVKRSPTYAGQHATRYTVTERKCLNRCGPLIRGSLSLGDFYFAPC